MRLIRTVVSAISLALFAASFTPASARFAALGSTFTYQGQLKASATLYSGTADFTFTLFDVAAGGSALGAAIPVNAVVVTNGVFTVSLDFGAAAFNGNERWLEIAVHTPGNGGVPPFATLTPRQKVNATPYALYALQAIISGTQPNAVTFSNAGNAFTGSGAALTSLNAANLGSGTVPSARLAGTYASALTLSSASNSFTGSGSGLTSLNASNISSGTLANARTTGVSTNTANTLVLRDASGNFSAGTITGTYSGSGASLTSLNASNISTGTLANARTTGTTANTPNTLVLRDGSGNVSAGALTITAAQRVYTVGALDFLNGQSAIPFLDTPELQNGVAAQSYYAPVHLPQGATVTSVSCQANDGDVGGDITVFLIRRTGSTGAGGGTMAQMTSTGSGVGQILTDSTISAPVIDNTGFVYFVRVDLPGSPVSFTSSVASVHINYTVTEPLP